MYSHSWRKKCTIGELQTNTDNRVGTDYKSPYTYPTALVMTVTLVAYLRRPEIYKAKVEDKSAAAWDATICAWIAIAQLVRDVHQPMVSAAHILQCGGKSINHTTDGKLGWHTNLLIERLVVGTVEHQSRRIGCRW